MGKEVALIIGVGAATGQAVCRALAARYTLVMVARSEGLITQLASELPEAHALACDVADRKAWQAALDVIRSRFGAPARILVNTEAAAWGAYNELSLEQLSKSFDVNVVSLLQLVQTLFPDQTHIRQDTRIMVSSSPAAYTPPARFLGLAPSRVAQRVLAELLHANLADAGLKFSVFSINGAIDEPKMRAAFPDQPTAFFIQPADIATEMVRCFDAETFELAAEIRGQSSFA